MPQRMQKRAPLWVTCFIYSYITSLWFIRVFQGRIVLVLYCLIIFLWTVHHAMHGEYLPYNHYIDSTSKTNTVHRLIDWKSRVYFGGGKVIDQPEFAVNSAIIAVENCCTRPKIYYTPMCVTPDIQIEHNKGGSFRVIRSWGFANPWSIRGVL